MITIAAIHDGIARELKRLDEMVEQIAQVGDQAAEAEAHYKLAYAKARLTVRASTSDKMTVGQIDDQAEEMTGDLRMAYLIAENRLTTSREALRASQARLDALRTLATSLRSAGG